MLSRRVVLLCFMALISCAGCGAPGSGGQAIRSATPLRSFIPEPSAAPDEPTAAMSAPTIARAEPSPNAVLQEPSATLQLRSASTTPTPQAAFWPTPEEQPQFASGFTHFGYPRVEPLCPPHQPAVNQLDGRLNLEQLKNTEHLVEGIGRVLFHDGKAQPEGWAIPGADPSSAGIEVNLDAPTPVFYGDIDGNGTEDAVVKLSAWTGGTGHWYPISIVLNEAGAPRSVASILFHDREWANAITVLAGDVQIDATVHNADDPLCCSSGKVRKVFRLCDGNMILVSQEEAG